MALDFDLIIALCKAVGVLVAGGLGAAAIIHSKLHDEVTGKLNARGKYFLVGICISSAVGIVTSVFETWKAKSESQEQAARTEQVLREINRSIQPIGEFKLSYWIEIPKGNTGVDQYIDRIRAGIDSRLPMLRNYSSAIQQDEIKGLSVTVLDRDASIWRVSISHESDLWPISTDEEGIKNLAEFMSVSIHMMRKPVNPENFAPVFGLTDFGVFENFLDARTHFEWDLKDQKLILSATVEFPKELWYSNGRISSVLDFYGAQMMVFFPGSSDYVVPEAFLQHGMKVNNTKELSRSLNIESFLLSFGNGRSISVSGDKFKKTKYKDGYPVFSVIFPSNEDDFRKFIK